MQRIQICRECDRERPCYSSYDDQDVPPKMQCDCIHYRKKTAKWRDESLGEANASTREHLDASSDECIEDCMRYHKETLRRLSE